MNWWRRFWHRAEDKSSEAQVELWKLEQRDGEVARLGRELRETQRRNNFSGMVQQAMSRTAGEGT